MTLNFWFSYLHPHVLGWQACVGHYAQSLWYWGWNPVSCMLGKHSGSWVTSTQERVFSHLSHYVLSRYEIRQILSRLLMILSYCLKVQWLKFQWLHFWTKGEIPVQTQNNIVGKSWALCIRGMFHYAYFKKKRFMNTYTPGTFANMPENFLKTFLLQQFWEVQELAQQMHPLKGGLTSPIV